MHAHHHTVHIIPVYIIHVQWRTQRMYMSVRKTYTTVYTTVYTTYVHCTRMLFLVLSYFLSIQFNSNKQANNGRLHISENTGKQAKPRRSARSYSRWPESTYDWRSTHTRLVHQADGLQCGGVPQCNSHHGRFNISFRLLELGVVMISAIRVSWHRRAAKTPDTNNSLTKHCIYICYVYIIHILICNPGTRWNIMWSRPKQLSR